MIKKVLTSALIVGTTYFASAQNIIFQDSFETYADFSIANVGGWTLKNVNTSNTGTPAGVTYANEGSPFAFINFNSQTTNPNINNSNSTYNWNWSARTGDKAMISIYKTSGTNNDWLISPSVTLGGSGNSLSFWAKSCSQSYSNELFEVSVSTTDTNPSSFTVISGSAPLSTSSHKLTWQEYTFNLDAYAGQTVYIAINCKSNDQFGFAVDDFKVTGNLLSTHEGNKAQGGFKLYPNPTSDIIKWNDAKDIKQMTIYDATGRTVKTVDEKALKANEVSVSDLKAGVYIVDVLQGTEHVKTKLIKK